VSLRDVKTKGSPDWLNVAVELEIMRNEVVL